VVNNQEARGVEIQILLDIGASASIINYDTFLQLRSQAHIPLQQSKVKLIAANAQPIPAKGECSLKFYYDLEGTNAYEGRYHITGKGINCQNLLGTDFITSETWDFNDSTVMNNRLNKIFPISTTSETNYPYCAILAQVRLDKKLQININSTKKLMINKKLKYATTVHKGTRTPEATHSVFKPFSKTEKTCLNFFSAINPVQSPKEE